MMINKGGDFSWVNFWAEIKQVWRSFSQGTYYEKTIEGFFSEMMSFLLNFDHYSKSLDCLNFGLFDHIKLFWKIWSTSKVRKNFQMPLCVNKYLQYLPNLRHQQFIENFIP